eukprot:gene15718-18674_t
MSHHNLSGSSGESSNNGSKKSSTASPIHSLRKKPNAMRQNLDQLMHMLSELSHSNSSSGTSTPHHDSPPISPRSGSSTNIGPTTTNGLSNHSSSSTSPHESKRSSQSTLPVMDPLLPVENFSSILNVQWTTYWTIHLVQTTTCIDILKYISQKTNRDIKFLKLADSEDSSTSLPTTEKGKILDNYFSHYYQELFKYIHQRSRRYQRVREFVKQGGFDDCVGATWMAKHYDSETNYLRNKRAGMKLKDFKILTQIGKGGFGQVYLAVKKDTGDVVTLKRIKKQSYQWANQRTQVSHEKTVMMSEAGGKWITKLLYAFQDSANLYLAMEYHCGGDFRALLNNLNMFCEEDARFYMVEMIEALNSLHSLKYIHRDIKPSNFVIDRHGHIKLIDFGLSKEGIESRNGFSQQTMNDLRKSYLLYAHSAVGSPEYMAPEIVSDEGYDLTCDYWSLGCVFMEMLCGFNPFCADTPNDVFINIIQWKEVLDWPLFTQELSSDAADILKRNGMTWDSILAQTPPFIPKVENDLDTSYFEDAVNNDPASWEVPDETSSGERREPFNNLNIPFFTYRKSSALNFDGLP